jgi:hypothetical protein
MEEIALTMPERLLKVTFTTAAIMIMLTGMEVMTYGDGSGTYFDILTSIDVAAHEIGHAICSNTANLAYQPESGAMNEAFLIFGSLC